MLKKPLLILLTLFKILLSLKHLKEGILEQELILLKDLNSELNEPPEIKKNSFISIPNASCYWVHLDNFTVFDISNLKSEE